MPGAGHPARLAVLSDAAKNGLPGDHHFYISFDTRSEGVRLSPRMRAQYPADMTIVLQHQFWDLIVTEELKKALAGGATIAQLKVLARKNNMLLLAEHGIRRFASGITAIHEVTRVLSAQQPAAGGSAAGKTSILPKTDGGSDK